jgi:hypothetical protein
MQQFIEKYRKQIHGVLTGFDRLVFRGSLRRLNYGRYDSSLKAMVAKGMEEYLWQNKILFKDYQDHVKRISERLKKATLEPFEKQKIPVIFLRDPSADKSKVARQVATERGVTSGLVCAISTLEPSPTFEHRGTHIIRRTRPCHVLYQYQIHPEFGWMHARIQTWFPFNIQVGLNGREWLARQMSREGLKYVQQGNCFLWLEDYQRAQELMNRQVEKNWAELLSGFAGQLNPEHESIFSRYPTSYYWTCDQSEWTTDIVFREAGFLKRLMPLLVRHGILSYSSTDVMRYFGRKVNLSGDIPAHFGGTLKTDLKRRQEGDRVKFSLNANSAKFYDKAYSEIGSVLREPPSSPSETFGLTGPKKEATKEIFNGERCAKESPTCTGGPRFPNRPTSGY